MAKLKKKKKKSFASRSFGGGPRGQQGSGKKPVQVAKKPPCGDRCPSGNQIRRFVTTLSQAEKLGKDRDRAFEEAWYIYTETSPFPAVCGRICPHPCEKECNRRELDGSVGVNKIERSIGDFGLERGLKLKKLTEEKRSEKVAIVGAGPAGLSAAHLLSLRGYQVTVFDAADKPGGMLRLGIPAYRLPRDVLDREIEALIDDNITLQMGVSLGKDITVDQLFDDGFGAVFLALGSMKSLPLRVSEEDTSGVYPSLRFLGEFNLHGKSLAKGKVGVIGGGNSAIDGARVALRQDGVEQVTIIYRRTREEMPAFAEEIDGALDEGVVLETLLSPVGIKTENGVLTGLECIKNELGARDASGRRRPVPIPGSEHVVPLDTLVVAVGEKPEIEGVCDERSDIEATRWGSLAADSYTLATSRRGVFAGGDVVTGPNTVVDAIAAGKRAAVMIDRYLRGEELRQPREGARPSRYVEPAQRDETTTSPERLTAPHAPLDERRSTFVEIEKVVTAETAQREASRCLRCDLEFCPDAGDPAQVAGDLRVGGVG